MTQARVGTMRIGLTSIVVDDQDQAEQFYTQMLGFQVQGNVGNVRPEGLSNVTTWLCRTTQTGSNRRRIVLIVPVWNAAGHGGLAR